MLLLEFPLSTDLGCDAHSHLLRHPLEIYYNSLHLVVVNIPSNIMWYKAQECRSMSLPSVVAPLLKRSFWKTRTKPTCFSYWIAPNWEKKNRPWRKEPVSALFAALPWSISTPLNSCLQIPKNLKKEASKLAHNKAPLLQLEIQNQTLGLESQSRCLL